MKSVSKQDEWKGVSSELSAETLKLKSYDKTLIAELDSVNGKKILDYGAGPGILASTLQKQGAKVKTYDLSKEMRQLCAEKIGEENVYDHPTSLPSNFFDVAICNLVLFIVGEEEVGRILVNLKNCLNETGIAYVGFCNPKIFNVPESALDFRMPSGNAYTENHSYKKIKKEGNYEIVELHRPIEWYENAFKNTGLNVQKILFTPEYELNQHTISDFVVFKLSKEEKQNA